MPLLLLTGYMGSGKSTVGREVARRLGWDFVDLDAAVIAEAGQDIPSIFSSEGEAGFRGREFAVLGKIIERAAFQDGLVVALGGGTLTNPASARLIDDRATVVYLDVDAARAWKRVRNSDRPLAQDREEFERRLVQRRPHYEQAAHLVVAAGEDSVKTLAERIADFVRPERGVE